MKRRLLAYVEAIGVVVLALMLRLPLTPILGERRPYLTLFGGIAVAVWIARFRPAAVAAVVGFVLGNLYFSDESLNNVSPIFLAFEFVAYCFSAGAIILVGESMHRQRDAAVESGELFRTTLTSIGDGVVVTDEKGLVRSLNPEAERLTGWLEADAKSRTLTEVFAIRNEQTGKVVENPVEKVLRSGTVVGLANHTVLVSKDGRTIPIDDSAAPIRRVGGPTLGVVLVFRDVSEQRSAQYAKERLAAIVESSGDAIIAKDLNGIIRTWNRSAERIFGYSEAEIVGKPVTTLIPQELVMEELEIMKRLRSDLPFERIETLRMAKDGRKVPVSIVVSPLRDSEGNVIGASKILRDISDIVAAREALAQEKDLLSTTLASIGDAVITTDKNAVITFLNPVAEALTGWTLKAAVGKPLVDIFQIVNEASRETVDNPALRALREGVVMGLANHTVLIRKDGTECPIDDSAAPIRDSDGAVVGCVLVFRDITERRRAESSLLAMDRRKNEFLATLAHELRNPLAPLNNSVEILRLAGGDQNLGQSAVATIDRQVKQITRLVDDLIDVARISQGKIILRNQTVELMTVLQQALETSRPLAESLGHKIYLKLPRDPVHLDADPVRLAQVFSNLVNNACKYMPPGGNIWINADTGDMKATISVRDEGEGISPEMISSIFEMFTQAGPAREHAQGGLGIGLTLVRQLVELHGGSVEAYSEGPGSGSEFRVRLPVVEPNGETMNTVSTAIPVRSKESRRVLVVDDNHDSAESLAILLRMSGHEIRLAYDGNEAIEAADEFKPELVLLDIGLPGLDGYEACRQIRQRDWARGAVIVALTGWGQEDDRRRSEEAGFDHHLVKPVDFVTLQNLLAGHSTAILTKSPS